VCKIPTYERKRRSEESTVLSKYASLNHDAMRAAKVELRRNISPHLLPTYTNYNDIVTLFSFLLSSSSLCCSAALELTGIAAVLVVSM
jgi:hypothetical protein